VGPFEKVKHMSELNDSMALRALQLYTGLWVALLLYWLYGTLRGTLKPLQTCNEALQLY